jgi:hypothetical protein
VFSLCSFQIFHGILHSIHKRSLPPDSAALRCGTTSVLTNACGQGSALVWLALLVPSSGQTDASSGYNKVSAERLQNFSRVRLRVGRPRMNSSRLRPWRRMGALGGLEFSEGGGVPEMDCLRFPFQPNQRVAVGRESQAKVSSFPFQRNQGPTRC